MKKRTFTNIRKWAEKMGYEVEDRNLVSWKPRIMVKVNEKLRFELEVRESTVYHSIRGMKGNAGGLYVTAHITGRNRSYDFHQASQRVAIESMESDIKQFA